MTLAVSTTGDTNRAAPRHGASMESSVVAAAKQMRDDPNVRWASVSLDSAWRSLSHAFSKAEPEPVFDFELGPQIHRPSLAPLVSRLSDLTEKAFPGFTYRVLATRRPWADAPVFHVDSSAFTIVAPIENAPTIIAPGATYVSTEILGPEGLPLGMETRRAADEVGESAFTDEHALVVIKGLGWSADHRAMVHSPPARLPGMTIRPTATALIVELTRPEGPIPPVRQ